MAEAYIGEVRLLPFQYAPEGWMECDGRVLVPQAQPALFSLIGTMYGGNGRDTFNLPDLRGAAVLSPGDGPGLRHYSIGEKWGEDGVALTNTAQIPTHNHTLTVQLMNLPAEPTAFTAAPVANQSYSSRYYHDLTVTSPGSYYSANPLPVPVGSTTTPAKPSPMAAASLGAAGGSGQAHENRQPFTVLRYCICVDGIYPPRP